MNVIDPLVITDAMVLSYDAAINAYSTGTDYSPGTKVKITNTTTRRVDIYQCQVANGPSSTIISPVTTIIDPVTNQLYWLFLGATMTAVEEEALSLWASGSWSIGNRVYKDRTVFENNVTYTIRDTYICISAATTEDPAQYANKWLFTGSIYETWVKATNYTSALGKRVMSLASDDTKHKVYESLVDNVPSNTEITDTTKWLEIGKNNKWSAFDFTRDSKTIIGQNLVSGYPYSQSASALMTVTITPGVRVDSVALLGMDANFVRIKVYSPSYTGTQNPVRGAAGTAYSVDDSKLIYDSGSINLKKRETTTHYQYYFKGFETVPSYAVFDIGVFSDNIFVITLQSTVGQVALGAVCLGLHENIGTIQYSAENDAINYSTFERDFFGNASALVPRRNVPKTIQQIWIDKKYINNVRVLRDALAGTVAVWCGLDDNSQSDFYEALLVLGVYKRFSINLASPSHAVISLELEEY